MDKFADTDELHVKADLLRLKYRREAHLMNLMFDLSKVSGKLKRPNKFGVSTRSSARKLFKIRKPRTEKYKKSASYIGPKVWNLLPDHIQQTDVKTEFKCKINAHYELKSLT